MAWNASSSMIAAHADCTNSSVALATASTRVPCTKPSQPDPEPAGRIP
jgi:hypothetical protein